MAYLLDTNIVIRLRDGEAAIEDRVAALSASAVLSIITRIELEGGGKLGVAVLESELLGSDSATRLANSGWPATSRRCGAYASANHVPDFPKRRRS